MCLLATHYCATQVRPNYHPFLKFISHITEIPGKICNFLAITELPDEQMPKNISLIH